MSDIAAEIPAIKELDSEVLRAAVVATWTASMDSSPYASLADVPQSPLPLMTARPLLQHVNEVNDLALHFLDLAVARFEPARRPRRHAGDGDPARRRQADDLPAR